MELKFIFTTIPRTPNKKKALEIAKRNQYFVDNQNCTVKFDKLNKDFFKIIDLAKEWSNKELYLDNEEVEIEDMLYLQNFHSTKELIDSIRIGDDFIVTLGNLEENINDLENDPDFSIPFVEDEDYKDLLFIKPCDDKNCFKIDKIELMNIINTYIQNNYYFISEYYDADEVKKIVDKLPDTFKLCEDEKNSEDDEIDKEEDEKEELARKIAEHPEFKSNQESTINFIKKKFPEIIDEWDSLAIKEIANKAKLIIKRDYYKEQSLKEFEAIELKKMEIELKILEEKLKRQKELEKKYK